MERSIWISLFHTFMDRKPACQTLFLNNRSSYFAVNGLKSKDILNPPSSMPDSSLGTASRGPSHSNTTELRHLIDLLLAKEEEAEGGWTTQDDVPINLISRDVRHRSQWLQITEWSRFLEPHQNRLSEIVALTSLPDPNRSAPD